MSVEAIAGTVMFAAVMGGLIGLGAWVCVQIVAAGAYALTEHCMSCDGRLQPGDDPEFCSQCEAELEALTREGCP